MPHPEKHSVDTVKENALAFLDDSIFGRRLFQPVGSINGMGADGTMTLIPLGITGGGPSVFYAPIGKFLNRMPLDY